MASQGYRDWLKAGKPYTLIRPANAIVVVVRGYGITVYHYPNDAHLQANTPEDHTPFSVTGWPGANRRWNARGVDIMPRSDSFAHRKENADIARQLIKDRDAGVPGVMWIKYINWTDEWGNCNQVRWTDAANPLKHTTRASSDRGHIHISGRSDIDNDDRANGYDPIARMKGQDMESDPLTQNAERGVTALYTGADPVVFPAPWGNEPQTGSEENPLPNPLVRLEKKIDDLFLGGISFDTLVAAVKQALLDPEVLRAVGDITFNSAQRAERE
jgi:hypothetical protein